MTALFLSIMPNYTKEMSTTIVMRGAKAPGLRVSKDAVAVATLVICSVGAIAGVIADMDVLMYLCGVTGVMSARSLDKEGGER